MENKRAKWHIKILLALIAVGLISPIIPLTYDGGRYKLHVRKAEAAANDVIILWDTANGAVPGGWTCISCLGGEAFYGVFPRGAAAYGAALAGVDTHVHTAAYSSATAGAANGGGGAGAAAPAAAHTHTWGNPTLTTVDIKPPYKHLNFIKAASPATIPNNAIAIFDGTLPTGWTRYTALDNVYLRGFSGNATGGAATHTHATSAAVTSGAASAAVADVGNLPDAASATHTHTLPASAPTGSSNNAPPYVDVIFAYNSSGGAAAIPGGLIAFFDATPPAGWASVSGSAPYLNNFLRGSATFGAIGGSSANHDHGATMAITSAAPSALYTKIGAGTTAASSTHTHGVSYTVSAVASMPVYRDVILAKRNAVMVEDGTLPASSYAKGSATNKAVSSFTLATVSSTDTVTQVKVTRGGTGVDADISGVKIWDEGATTLGQYNGTETQIGTTQTFTAGVATFSALTIAVNTTAKNFLVTYDTAAAPTNANTHTGYVSSVTATLPISNSDNADATLTIDTVAPSYTWNTPTANSWYKNGSVFSVDVDVIELGSGVADASNCNFKIDAGTTGFTGSATYALGTGKCTGTITITTLTDATHNLTVGLADNVANASTSANQPIKIDNTAPAAIANLLAPSSTGASVDLTWTNPSDGTGSGNASFDVRYTTGSQTQAFMNTNWASLTQASGEPTPPTTGMTVSGLTCSTTYTFAIKTTDNVDNISATSNAASNTTTAVCNAVPSAVSNLSASAVSARSITLKWTIPTDAETYVKTYDLRFVDAVNYPLNLDTGSEFDTNAPWATANQAAKEPTHTYNAAGTIKYFPLKCAWNDVSNDVCNTTTDGKKTLYPNTLYYIAARAKDTENAESLTSVPTNPLPATGASHTALKYGYNSFSLPYDWTFQSNCSTANSTNTIANIFGDDVTGPYLYNWVSSGLDVGGVWAGSWSPVGAGTILNTMPNGKGYYIYSNRFSDVQDAYNSAGTLMACDKSPDATNIYYRVQLSQGRNIIGNPWLKNLPASTSLRVCLNPTGFSSSTGCSGAAADIKTFAAAATAGWVEGAIYHLQNKTAWVAETCSGATCTDAKLRPWWGHVVYLNNAGTYWLEFKKP